MERKELIEQFLSIQMPSKGEFLRAVNALFDEYDTAALDAKRQPIPEGFEKYPYEYLLLYCFDMMYLHPMRCAISTSSWFVEKSMVEEYDNLVRAFSDIGSSLIENFNVNLFYKVKNHINF